MIYIDVSHVIHYVEKSWNVSGIQRVTIECVKGLRAQLGSNFVSLIKYDNKLNRLLFAPVGLFDDLETAQGNSEKLKKCQTDGDNRWRPAVFKSGCKMLLSEGLGEVGRFELFKAAKEQAGLRVYQIIYDVIPIAKPKFSSGPTVKGYVSTIPKALALADEIITISDYSKQDILRFCADWLKPNTPINVWKLPHEFSAQRKPNQTLPAEVTRRYVVFGGTIEDRKNQHLVVNAWRILAVKHKERMPQLVLVGKFGKTTPMHIKIRVQLALEGFGSKNIVALGKCNDATLRALYDDCLFSIYVSSYEGWGLPIGEGLWCGRPVLASTSTSLPEVGGDLADYVNPDDEKALMAAIEKLAFNDVYREGRAKNISREKLRDWKAAISELGSYINAPSLHVANLATSQA